MLLRSKTLIFRSQQGKTRTLSGTAYATRNCWTLQVFFSADSLAHLREVYMKLWQLYELPAAAQTIHIHRFLQLWVSHIQRMFWKQTQTSDNKHITLSLCSISVFAHPTPKRNRLQPKACVLFAGWPLWKTWGGEGAAFQPALTPRILQELWQGSAHCSFARTAEGICQQMASSLWPVTQTKSRHWILIKFFRTLVYTEVRHLGLFETLQTRS